MADIPYTPVCLSVDSKPSDDDKCHGVTNEAYVFAAQQQAKTTYTLGSIDIAVMLAFALWQRNTSKDIANLQEDVADQQMQLAEKLHAHVKQFWSYEKALVDEAFGEARAVTDYTGLSAGWKGYLTDSLNTGRQEWIDAMGRCCLDASPCEDARWQRMAQMSEADMLAFGARQAEARALSLRNRRYEKQYNALKLGHGILSPSMALQTVALSLGTQSHNALFGTINSMLHETGYWAQYKRPTMWSHLPTGSVGGVLNYQPNPTGMSGFNTNPVQQTALPPPRVDVTVNTGKAAGMNGGLEGGGRLDDLYTDFSKNGSALWNNFKRD